MKKLALLVFPLLLAACNPEGVKEEISFMEPDIKNEFCGVHINFQYCKCAFHNEYCNSVDMDKAQAAAHVQAAYDEWVAEQQLAFSDYCESTNGYMMNHHECVICDIGYLAKNNTCESVADQ